MTESAKSKKMPFSQKKKECFLDRIVDNNIERDYTETTNIEVIIKKHSRHA
jgi:hypothetical protein